MIAGMPVCNIFKPAVLGDADRDMEFFAVFVLSRPCWKKNAEESDAEPFQERNPGHIPQRVLEPGRNRPAPDKLGFPAPLQHKTTFMKHSFKDWIIAVRPWSFPASAMPVIASMGYTYAYHENPDWINGIWALLNIIIFHAAGNTWSDYFDYKRKVDAEDTFGVRTLTKKLFKPKEIYHLSWGLLIAAVAGGTGLWLRTGMPLLYIGLGGLACSILYPCLKYRALGDFVIFIAYGLLPTVGTVYAMSSQLSPEVLYIALPIGLITVAILHCNNTRDIQTDSRACIRTIAMNIGAKASIRL